MTAQDVVLNDFVQCFFIACFGIVFFWGLREVWRNLTKK